MNTKCQFCGSDVGNNETNKQYKICPKCVDIKFNEAKNKNLKVLQKDMRQG